MASSPSNPADSPAAAGATPSLSYSSYNDDKPTTIILLHGGFTSRLEFALALPHLLRSPFHILLPDQPLHSASRDIRPGTTDSSARHVAQLIRARARGGRAHVVGVSMGGYVAQCLALEQPDVVLSLFVTGAAPLVGRRLFMARWTGVTYYTMKLMLCWLPPWVYLYQSSAAGLRIGDELMAELRGNITWDLVQDMFTWILSFTVDDVRRLGVRTLSIAGAKGDDVPMMERTAEALRSRRTDAGEVWPEDGSGGVVIREAIHAWDMQLPELFARGVLAWVSGEELPAEFERV